MEIVFIGLLFMTGVYLAPFVLFGVVAFFAFLGAGFINIIERFKR